MREAGALLEERQTDMRPSGKERKRTGKKVPYLLKLFFYLLPTLLLLLLLLLPPKVILLSSRSQELQDRAAGFSPKLFFPPTAFPFFSVLPMRSLCFRGHLYIHSYFGSQNGRREESINHPSIYCQSLHWIEVNRGFKWEEVIVREIGIDSRFIVGIGTNQLMRIRCFFVVIPSWRFLRLRLVYFCY